MWSQKILFGAFLGILLWSGAWAQAAATGEGKAAPADSLRPVSNEEVLAIAKKLMAPCCWSETADIHQSQAAEEVRAQIRSALARGYTEKQILQAFEQAYGERILARPHARGFNLLVWILPGVLLVFAGWGAGKYIQRSRAKQPPSRPKPARKAGGKKGSPQDSYEARVEQELKELDI